MGQAESVILVGVGGQGILLAANVLARTALLAGHDVKTNEVHGMAQRGGSVVAEIRYGSRVRSPLIEPGTARALAALEQIEALRYAHYLRPGGVATAAQTKLVPASVSAGMGAYPGDVVERLRRAFPDLRLVDAAAIAVRAGDPRTTNLVVLGALSTCLDFPAELWEKAIGGCVKPEFLAMNLSAFSLGRESGR